MQGNIETWIEIWKWTYTVMIGLFYAIVLIIIPLGARDLVHLFRLLGENDDKKPE